MIGSAPRNPVEALFEIGRDREYVAGIAQRHLLAQIDPELIVSYMAYREPKGAGFFAVQNAFAVTELKIKPRLRMV
jgi:hypothetical protein